MKTTICKYCAKSFAYVPVKVGDIISHIDLSGQPVRCQNETTPAFCPKCVRACKVKDGRP